MKKIMIYYSGGVLVVSSTMLRKCLLSNDFTTVLLGGLACIAGILISVGVVRLCGY